MRIRGIPPGIPCVLGFLSVVAVGLSATGRAAEAGRVFVKSKPSGALVFLDSETKPRGKTPCLLSGIPVGAHVLRASLPGYADVTQDVEVPRGTAKVTLTFAAKAARPSAGEDGTTPAPDDTASAVPDEFGDEKGTRTPPAGVIARERRGVAVVRAPTTEAPASNNWLLLIAVNRYVEWPPLLGPRADAEGLRDVLLSRYAFARRNLIELYDEHATLAGIHRTFRELGEKVRPEDSLLICYAGHGHKDEFIGTGYWIPHDAGKDRVAHERWLPNSDIRGVLRAIECRRILLISDSCFSGDLLDQQRVAEPEIDSEYFLRAYSMRARQVLTSGSSEPVSDATLGGHSAFAFHLIDTLKSNREPCIDPLQIYVHIRAGVKGQMSLLGNLKGAGHQEGGAYLFFLRGGGTRPSPWVPERRRSRATTARDRQSAVRAGAERLVGKKVTLRTTKGIRKGKVESIGEGGILLVLEIVINGRVVGEKRFTVPWSELRPDQEDELAKSGGWRGY